MTNTVRILDEAATTLYEAGKRSGTTRFPLGVSCADGEIAKAYFIQLEL